MGFVYEITNLKNRKRYVGSTTQLKRRIRQHFSDLRCRRHYNNYLQHAFDKCGESAFEWSILEEITNKNLAKRENAWIKLRKSDQRKYGYNLTDQPYAPMRGKRHTAAAKAIMSKQRQGALHPNAKLNEDTIVEIFRLFNKGLNSIQIGRKIGADFTNVSLILRGKAWRHLGLSILKKGRKRINNKSGFVGVYKTRGGKWKAEIIINKKYHNLGIYSNKKDAVRARKAAEKV